MSPPRPDSLLIVDDDDRFRERLALAFRRRGYEVVTAGSAEEAVAAAGRIPFTAAVLDLCMPGDNGLVLLERLRGLRPDLRVLVVTGYGSIRTAKDALRQGAVDYLTKPTDAEEIERALRGESRKEVPPEADSQEVPSLERVEWEHIQNVLADAGGNVSEAARQLGIERRTLQRKLRKYPPPR